MWGYISLLKREFLWQRIVSGLRAGTSADLPDSARGFPAVHHRPEFVRPARGKRVLPGFCGPAVSTQRTHRVRLAEWSKAPDLSSGSRERAWVRTPHLTKQPFGRISLVGWATVLADFSFEGGAGVCSFGTPLWCTFGCIGVSRPNKANTHSWPTQPNYAHFENLLWTDFMINSFSFKRLRIYSMKMMVCAERIDPVLVLPFADVTVCLLILSWIVYSLPVRVVAYIYVKYELQSFAD